MAGKAVSLVKQSYNASISSSYIERLCTSWFLPSPALFIFRALVSLYAFLVEVTSSAYSATHGDAENAQHSFSYFTNLSYWGIAFYFAFAAAHTASYTYFGRAWLESWPGVLKWLHSTLHATITIYPFIVTGMCRNLRCIVDSMADSEAMKLSSGQSSPMGPLDRRTWHGQTYQSMPSTPSLLFWRSS